MVNVCYYNIRNFPEASFDVYLNVLPGTFRKEVLKYVKYNDRLLCLIGKLLVWRLYKQEGYTITDFEKNFKRNDNNKPLIEDWKCFNISHSGQMVIVALSDFSDEIGIDLEMIDHSTEVFSLLSFFCDEEQSLIKNDKNPHGRFFEIWTRKEALLKATGVGIIDGLSHFSCLQDIVMLNGKTWKIDQLGVSEGFSCSLARPFYGNKHLKDINLTEVYNRDFLNDEIFNNT